MPWLRLESTFARHRKIRRLAEILKIPIYSARGLVAGLLCKVCAEQPDGVLDDWNAGDVAWSCDWTGDAQALYDALCDVRLIVKNNEHTEINDWMVYAAGYREAERARKYRVNKKSRNNTERVTDEYVTHHVRVTDPPVTRHADRTGPDHIDTCGDEPIAQTSNDPKSNKRRLVNGDVDRVWQHYRVHHPRSPEVLKSSRKEYRLIKQRLEDFDVATLQRAIDGYHRSPFHTGTNDRGKRYLSLDLMLRDISHVQAGLEFLEPAGGGNGSKRLLDTQLKNGNKPV